MTTQVRALGFTNSVQQLTWDGADGSPVRVYLWGAGGGGGGYNWWSGEYGGTGGGGGFSQYNFTVNNGDLIQVFVGGKGSGGGFNSYSAGVGGASYLGYQGGNGGGGSPYAYYYDDFYTGFYYNRYYSGGGGGGGGGATVLLVNGSVVSVAGGGGGGAGSDRFSNDAENAPGIQGQSATDTAGGNGQYNYRYFFVLFNRTGGGGGGGGGLRGGIGGESDNFFFNNQRTAGAYGSSSAPNENPVGQTPGGTSNQYYNGIPGRGGASNADGTSGYAVFEFDINGCFVNIPGGGFRPVDIFANINNTWKPVEVTWIKTNGVWEPIQGGYAPDFSKGAALLPDRVCISVIDECSRSASSIQNSWNSFKARYPNRPLYVLQPPGFAFGDNNLRIPYNFNTGSLGYGPIPVTRDNGNPAARSDWFALCNIGAYPGTTIELSIDSSGSMNADSVGASYSYFIQRCNAAGNPVILRSMPNEDWIAPF
jgi:hypothetical protein